MGNVTYRSSRESDVALKVIADHGEPAIFDWRWRHALDGDEAMLRQIARRAIHYGVRLGLTDPFMAKVSNWSSKKWALHTDLQEQAYL